MNLSDLQVHVQTSSGGSHVSKIQGEPSSFDVIGPHPQLAIVVLHRFSQGAEELRSRVSGGGKYSRYE